jgi:hypothetical protein
MAPVDINRKQVMRPWSSLNRYLWKNGMNGYRHSKQIEKA